MQEKLNKLNNNLFSSNDEILLLKGPKIVAIGGGTGLSTMLRGLKYFTSNITAIVTVGDDGGGSGVLRQDLGMLPPGDIRNCILALADIEPIMDNLIRYRFTEGSLKGQNFGNLLLAALTGIYGEFEIAVQKMSDVLAVRGKVLPVTINDMILKAKLENGTIVIGESNIPVISLEQNSKIERLFISPEDCIALDEAITAIREADSIIIGPGSLYTSVMPNLLVKDILKALKSTKAIKIYVCNIMTQPGETDSYTAKSHLDAIYNHVGGNIFDYIIVNKKDISSDLERKYLDGNSSLVKYNPHELNEFGIKLIEEDLIKVNSKGLIRHDEYKLSSLIMRTIMKEVTKFSDHKIRHYFRLSERLRDKETS
ncbi:MAG: uridine diphosphate-N-acetylglucosamine-binding protein YvcK [Oscillospiraceae bacterium]|nr:uridine diphosphate-N-acetylglucosamine-binding protein YvcK [Oscillospiraceae bacterium]